MSTQEVGKYRQFFDVDEKYFPCIDDSAIEAGAPWENTYPHETFIELLKNVETMLGGTTKRSVWIHGAYGTGKSQCAYALKKILEVPEEELKAYWNQYEACCAKQALKGGSPCWRTLLKSIGLCLRVVQWICAKALMVSR